MKVFLLKIVAIISIIRYPTWTLLVMDKAEITKFLKGEKFDIKAVYKGKEYISKVMVRSVANEICTDDDIILSKAEFDAVYELKELK